MLIRVTTSHIRSVRFLHVFFCWNPYSLSQSAQFRINLTSCPPFVGHVTGGKGGGKTFRAPKSFSRLFVGPGGFEHVTGGGATIENCDVSKLTLGCPKKTFATMKSFFYCKPLHTFLKETLDLKQTLSSLESLYCRNWHMLLPLCSRLVPYGFN